MMRLRFLLPVLGFTSLSLFAAACGDGHDDPVGNGGAGGEAPGPANTGGEVGAGGACASDGSGTVVVEVTGLPDGVAPDVSIAGPDMLNVTEAGPLEAVAAGSYTVTAARVFDADPLVRTVYDATLTGSDFCLGDGESHTIKVTYKAIPSSNKLWMTTGKADELAGFASASIAATGMTDADVSIDTSGAVSIAFDKDGNLWAVGPTIGEDMLVRIPAAELGASGKRTPDVAIKVPAIECFPFINHIAFDSTGNLWLSACGDEIRSIAAADLKTSGDKRSDVVLTGLTNNAGIAFDKDGNLWVAGGPAVLRFDAANLSGSGTTAADASLTITAATADKTVLGAEELAFDKAGNLWGVASSSIFQLKSADLAGAGKANVKANISFTIDVLALPSTPAFDDGNALWVGLADGQLGKFSPTQLGKSVAPGTPVKPSVLITSDSISSGLPVALFPAPAGLPLYHSIPEP